MLLSLPSINRVLLKSFVILVCAKYYVGSKEPEALEEHRILYCDNSRLNPVLRLITCSLFTQFAIFFLRRRITDKAAIAG
jgi:hypothetical protein